MLLYSSIIKKIKREVFQITISNRIKELRHALNLSQEEFGESLGTSHGAVGMWENERRRVTKSITMLISLKYGVAMSWLETGKGEMFSLLEKEKEKALKNLAVLYQLEEQEKNLVRNFLGLEKEKREEFSETLKKIIL